MRKIIALVLVLLLLVPSVGMGAEKEVLCGALAKMGVSEKTLNADLADSNEFKTFSAFKFFDTLNSMLSALGSGRIAAFQIDSYTANYLLSRTEQYAVFQPSGVHMYNLNFSMLVRDENEELCKSISSVISDMKADGTI